MTRVWRRARPLLTCALLTLGLWLPGPVHAQTGGSTPTDSTVRTLIPSLIALRRPATTPSFDINVNNFPPAQYPARYLSDEQDFSVFASASTPWTVQMEVQATPDDQGHTVPVDHLSYRINGGPWIKATGAPQVVMSQVGPTPGWAPLKVQLALDLLGGESGGDYAFDFTFTAQVLP